jgi:alanine racemase
VNDPPTGLAVEALTRATATIDLDALARNYHLLTDRLGGRRPAAMVKADGYGLGAAPVSRRLRVEGCTRFFVARLDEGIELREALPEAEICVLDGPQPGTEGELLGAGLVPVLNGLDQVERWRHTATAAGRPLPAALHFDTGMRRLGIPAGEAETLAARPDLLQGLDIRHVMSHLASADVAGSPQSAGQLELFRAIRARFPDGLASLANSAGIFLDPAYHFDLARPGIALYGGSPHPGDDRPNPMDPVLTLEAPVLQVQRVEAGQPVGYGATHVPDRTTRLATIPVGYADGFLRSASNRGEVAIGDDRAPIVGRISMDLVILDVGHLPEGAVRPGTAVELIGGRCLVDEVAARAGTIANELLTGLGRRYRRRYLGGAGEDEG